MRLTSFDVLQCEPINTIYKGINTGAPVTPEGFSQFQQEPKDEGATPRFASHAPLVIWVEHTRNSGTEMR